MKGLERVRAVPNLYATWISNFSCAPDSFMLHYLRWMMGRKPYLVLEIDSHTADAGLDTRIEAFLDIVDSFRRDGPAAGGCPVPFGATGSTIASSLRPSSTRGARSGSACAIRGSRSSGRRSAISAGPAFAAATRKQGVHVEYLPVPTARSTQLARNVASGKECIPALLVLGSVLEFIGSRTPRRPDEALLVAVPSTLGPCRTGQYHVFYDRLFDELGLDHVALLRVGRRVVVRGARARVRRATCGAPSCSPTTSPTSGPESVCARAMSARRWPSSSAPGRAWSPRSSASRQRAGGRARAARGTCWPRSRGGGRWRT